MASIVTTVDDSGDITVVLDDSDLDEIRDGHPIVLGTNAPRTVIHVVSVRDYPKPRRR